MLTNPCDCNRQKINQWSARMKNLPWWLRRTMLLQGQRMGIKNNNNNNNNWIHKNIQLWGKATLVSLNLINLYAENIYIGIVFMGIDPFEVNPCSVPLQCELDHWEIHHIMAKVRECFPGGPLAGIILTPSVQVRTTLTLNVLPNTFSIGLALLREVTHRPLYADARKITQKMSPMCNF